MKQEDKDLLLKDLCARLPYGVKCNIGEEMPYTLCQVEIDNENGHLLDFIETKNGLDMQVYLSEVKPCLFPMSSMTEWQERELEILMKNSIESCGMLTPYDCLEMERFFNENHIDWRGLIPKALAIDATNLNIY